MRAAYVKLRAVGRAAFCSAFFEIDRRDRRRTGGIRQVATMIVEGKETG
jgi:hypothetical protein